MGRAPCCVKVGLNRGPWTREEDRVLIDHVNQNGHGNWRKLPKKAGLLRCGKSCRLRWLNYLKPDVKRGDFTKEEEDNLIKLQQELGNKWSAIAKLMPGRTDNEIKNVWNTHLKNKVDDDTPLVTKKRHRKRSQIAKVVTQNNENPQVQNAQDSTSDAKSTNHAIEATDNVDQNSANLSSSSDEKLSTSPSVSVASNNNDDSLRQLLDIEDDFSWTDVMSTDWYNNIIPSFDENLDDENMAFWYNIYTRDESIEDFLQEY